MQKQPDALQRTASEVEKIVRTSADGFERTLIPVRRELWRRYPVPFLLLATAGLTAVFTGIEQLLLSVEWLRTQPWLIVLLGVVILILTGTVYKKLS